MGLNMLITVYDMVGEIAIQNTLQRGEHMRFISWIKSLLSEVNK